MRRKPTLPPLLLGCSALIGAGQFGRKSAEYYARFYLQPENMVRLFERSFELGVKAVQLLHDRPIDALLEASMRTGVKPYVVYSTELFGAKLQQALDKLKPLSPQVVAVHAEVADRHDWSRVMERLRIIEEFDATPGIATHKPGVTIPWIEKEDLPVDVILAPLNKIGYGMEPDFQQSLRAIEECSRAIVAIKPLAAGRLRATEAFEFVYKYVGCAAVGVASEDEMSQTYQAAREAYAESR